MTLADDIRAYAQELFRRVQTFRMQSHPGFQTQLPSATTLEEQDLALALYGLENHARALRLDLDPEGKAIEGRVFQGLTGSVTIDAVLPAGQEPPDPAS